MNAEQRITAWIENGGNHFNSHSKFALLQIAYATAFRLADDHPDWAWPEYQVQADAYTRLIRSGPRFFKPANGFQMMQSENARRP
ncbi:hypothetical protein Q9L58_010453 [Maublancomyces gigas]|uniref:Uncharacterized protein n=1 Tax=Discina gigas TaxID=1032678 RepID=A0ABR3G415_9PEZI